ncbi:hypothetical protein CcaverHIS002_0400040 [Cutaneotrichosporon cavernicola]|nr:hypothetical protein CcaverHIS002_0400040 [Cutaneotrichosporon cavernicola]
MLIYRGNKLTVSYFGLVQWEQGNDHSDARRDDVIKYLGAATEVKRYARLPDESIVALQDAWRRGDRFDALLGGADTTPTFNLDGVAVEGALRSALYFILEAATYGWAAWTRFGIATNGLAWVPAQTSVAGKEITVTYGHPLGSFKNGDLLRYSPPTAHGKRPCKRTRTQARQLLSMTPPSSHNVTLPHPISLFGFLVLAAIGAIKSRVECSLLYAGGDDGIVNPDEPIPGWRRSLRGR